MKLFFIYTAAEFEQNFTFETLKKVILSITFSFAIRVALALIIEFQNWNYRCK